MTTFGLAGGMSRATTAREKSVVKGGARPEAERRSPKKPKKERKGPAQTKARAARAADDALANAKCSEEENVSPPPVYRF